MIQDVAGAVITHWKGKTNPDLPVFASIEVVFAA
jgi:hypothetical protein